MHSDKELEKRIGGMRIERLFELAKQRAERGKGDDILLSKRYLKIAKQISSHYKIRMQDSTGKMICGECGQLLLPGRNCSVRISGGFVVYRCACGGERRLFLKRK